MAKDWTGKKYNWLTFVKPTDNKTKSGNIIWELICACGNTTKTIPTNVVRGHTKSCGCAQYDTRSRLGLSCRKFDPTISTARYVWQRTYSDGDIDFDTFFKLSQLNCHYCKSPPSKTYNVASTNKRSKIQIEGGNFTFNGIDRVDSSKAHDVENVVTCCYICNIAKNSLSYKEFLLHIEKMYEGTANLRKRLHTDEE